MGACISANNVVKLSLLASNHSLVNLGSVTPFSAINTLQSFYNKTSGMFGTYPADFWTSANGVEALINYIAESGDRSFATDVPSTFTAVSGEYFASGYFDDQLWFANAWIRQFEVSKNSSYLEQANSIVVEMIEIHDAWTPTCGGGVNWGINHNYKNTITNVLFGLACAKLHAYGLPGADGKGFNVWAMVRDKILEQQGISD
jgi:hypothetical protein